MRPTELASAIAALMQSGRPAFIWGPPGVCKSSIIREVAASQNRPLVDIRAALLDPVDLRGLPRITAEGTSQWCPPAFLPSDPGSEAIIFLDELPQAPAMVQSACLQLTLDRRLGEYELPAACSIIAAGNRQEDRAGAHRMITPLLNRFVHLDVEVSNDDWQAWALRSGIDPRVRGFIKWRPASLFAFDPKAADQRAFPTPRSWHFVSDCIRNLPPDVRLFDIAAGCVGSGAASEFQSFCTVYSKLPDPEAVLANPKGFPLPSGSDASVMYALVGALTELIRSKPAKAGDLAIFASRLPAEFGVLCMRDAVAVCPAILATPAGSAWIKANRDTLNLGMVKP